MAFLTRSSSIIAMHVVGRVVRPSTPRAGEIWRGEEETFLDSP
jgi:hypothetical protein